MMRGCPLVLCLCLTTLALSSCHVYAPVYKRVENFRMVRIDRDGFKVYGDVVLYNPNKMRCKLNDVLVNIELDSKHVATAGQQVPVRIRAQSEFSVPLDLVIKPDMSPGDGLKNIFHIIRTKEMDVTINGVVVVKAYGVKVSIPIKQEEKVDITKLR